MAEAHRCLNELLLRQPDNFDALVRHGWTSQNQSWYPQAVESLRKALALRPEADAVRLSLAEIQVALGYFAEAQEHFEVLRERQPDNPSVLFGLARCLAGRGDKEQALELLDRLLADHPNDWKALGERGWLAVQLDRPAEAESYFRRAESLAAPDLPLLIRFADCLRLLGKHDEERDYRGKADRLKADIQRAGPYFQARHLGRGVALDDLDNDGRTDIVLNPMNEAVVLLRNRHDVGHHWLGVQLIGQPYRDAVGARLELEVNGQKLVRVIKGGGSYLSSGDRRVVFGLGTCDKVGRLTVRWPSGKTQTWEGLSVDRYWKFGGGS